MKIHRYYLMTTPWWIIHGNLKPMDTHAILFRLGYALGMIVDKPVVKQDWRESKASWARQTVR